MRLVGWMAALFAIAPARATMADYDPSNEAWNGLSELYAIASREGIAIEAPSVFDARELETSDGLLIVYPKRRLPTDTLLAYLRAGGRIALADDFGEGQSLLSRFGIERAPPPSESAARLRGSAALLIARPRILHPLSDRIEALVTNHPAALRHHELEPLYAFDDGSDALVLSGVVGDGRLVAIGDPSLFINEMISLENNRLFATALLRFLADADPATGHRGRIVLIRSDAYLKGGPSDDLEADPVERANDFLATLARSEIPPAGLSIAALLLCGIFAAFASGLVNLRGPYEARAMLPSGERPHPPSIGTNLLQPTLMYKSQLETSLAAAIGLPSESSAASVREAFESRATAVPAALEAATLLSELAAIEAATRAGGPPPVVSPKHFTRIRAKGESLLGRLDGDSNA